MYFFLVHLIAIVSAWNNGVDRELMATFVFDWFSRELVVSLFQASVTSPDLVLIILLFVLIVYAVQYTFVLLDLAFV